MIRNRLRLYSGPEVHQTSVISESQHARKVTVPAREVFAALADAIENNRTWLADFEDDEITVSSDLYDVVMAYEHFRRPSA